MKCFPYHAVANLKQRIFSYSTASDRLLIGVAAVASICTGVTLPLMNIVFGNLHFRSEGDHKEV